MILNETCKIKKLKKKSQKLFIYKIIKDTQAAHIVEKILTNYCEDEIEFIYQELIENLILLSNDMKGLCVVKKVIQLTTKENLKLSNELKTNRRHSERKNVILFIFHFSYLIIHESV